MFIILEAIIAVFIIAMVIWAAFCVEDERVSVSIFGTALLVAIILGASQYFYGFVNTLYALVLANPILILGFVAAYFVIGALYVLFWRYQAYLEDHSDGIKTCFKNWKRTNQIEKSGIPEHEIKQSFIESDYYAQAYGPGKKKSLITTWILWWPLSLTYHISYRPVKYICEKIYEYIAKWLTSIFKRSSKNIIG